MSKSKFQICELENRSRFFSRKRAVLIIAFVFSAVWLYAVAVAGRYPVSAQSVEILQTATAPSTHFRVGERLTYNVSFENFANAAYAEIYAVSRGKLGEKNAVELRSKIKTIDLVSSTFYSVNEERTTFASAETNLPLYIRKSFNLGVLPREIIYNYLVSPAATNDLLTFIYQARNAGGVGTFTFQEDGNSYRINLQNSIGERVRTAAGEFETGVSTVESPYLTEKGITNMRVNFSADEARIPVLIRFKTAKGEFRAELASLQNAVPETVVAAQPSLTPVQAAVLPQRTPTPRPTPTPYIENQPLSTDLPFQLGETLEYQISQLGKYFGNVTLQARERKQFSGLDSLLLTATASETQAGNPLFNLNDGIIARVNPDSLAPQQIEIKSTGFFKQFNQTALFDQKTGFVNVGGASRTQVPVGTHSLLSLAYAVRSFNLKPSKDPSNPVNDTRVAVFAGAQAYVFTLRPSNGDLINLKGEKVGAQLISVTTGNPAVDQLGIRVWLGTDEKRLPLRMSVGSYQADLISETKVAPK